MTAIVEKIQKLPIEKSTGLRHLFAKKYDSVSPNQVPFDTLFIVLSITLMSLGLVIVTSASMPVAERLHDNAFYFAIRHGIYIVIALVAAIIVLQIPMHWWRVSNPWLLLAAAGLLIAVLLVGRSVNGSTRWLSLGPITVQAAEPVKLFFFCYLAGYLVRRYEEVTENLKGFIKPLLVFFALAILLLMQPDLGTVVVMFATTIGLLFLAGAKLWQFFGLVITGLSAIVALILVEDYRLERAKIFLNPWEDAFGAGYQLTQSLMAYGRGDIFGQGLGNSLQKLEYLPEAHTDFIVAILAEELGFFGVVVVLAILFTMVFKALKLGNIALANERPFDAYLAYAIGIWISLQTAVNVGASAGVLPTKGLTLPLISYGGSSLVVMSVAIAILIRIDFEIRVDGVQAMSKNKLAKGAANTAKSKAKRKVNKVIKDVIDVEHGGTNV